MTRFNQYLATFSASIGAFSLGTVMGWSTLAIPRMEKTPEFSSMTTEEKSWIGSMALLGAIVSSPVGGILMDKLGTKNCIILFSLPLFVGWVLISTATSVSTVYMGRFITGLCGGSYALTVPVYITEIGDNTIRGILTTGFCLLMAMGIFFTYVVGVYVKWRNLSWICSIFSFFPLYLFAFYIPESPRYLIKNSEDDNAMAALKYFRDHDHTPEEINEEFAELQKIVRRKDNPPTLLEITAKKSMWPLALNLSLMVIEQLTAFIAVIFYAKQIFDAAGLHKYADLSTITIGLVQVIGTVCNGFVVDSRGRRFALIMSQSLIILTLAVLGAYFYVKSTHKYISLESFIFIPVIAMALYIFAYSLGIGSLTWTMGEILPPNEIGIFSTISNSFYYSLAFLVTKTYDQIVEAIGLEWVFWGYGLTSIMCTIFIILYIPETKGKSLEEIDTMFDKSITPSNSITSKSSRIAIIS